MPQYDVRLTTLVETRVIIEARSEEAAKEFCWGNHDMLRKIGENQEFPQDNVVLSTVPESMPMDPHVKLNSLQRMQDL